MKEKKIRKMMNEALELYDKGEWNKAIEMLNAASEKAAGDGNLEVLREIYTYLGWNYWKKQDKEKAQDYWLDAIDYSTCSFRTYGTPITQASAHAGLGIYYAEKGDKENALRHAKLAQELLPANATINQAMNLNACGISLAKIGELDRAEEILRKAAKINEELEGSEDLPIAKKAKHQRAKNGYNLASLVLIPRGKYVEAIKELYREVIYRYSDVGAETDLAAAYHRLSEAYEKMAETAETDGKAGQLTMALVYEKISRDLWEKHQDDPSRLKTAEENIKRFEGKIAKLKQ